MVSNARISAQETLESGEPIRKGATSFKMRTSLIK
jgi:hypothetical protein